MTMACRRVLLRALALSIGVAATSWLGGPLSGHGAGESVAPHYQWIEQGAARVLVGMSCVPSSPVALEEVQCEFRATRTGPDGSSHPAVSAVRAIADDGARGAGEALDIHPGHEPGVYAVRHRFSAAGDYDVAVTWSLDGGPLSRRIRVPVVAGMTRVVRTAVVTAVGAGILMLASSFWRRRRDTLASRPEAAPGILRPAALVVTALVALIAIDRTLTPRVAARLLPQRAAVSVDWSPDHAPAAPAPASNRNTPRVVVPPTVVVLGTVRPRPELQAVVFAPIWGRIEFAERPLAVGTRVTKGQHLLQVILELPANERYPMQVRAEDIRAELESAKTRRQQAEWQRRRAVDMLKGSPADAFWRQEVESTERILRAALEEEELLTRQVSAYQAVMKRRDPRVTIVEAPIGGTVTDVKFVPGQLNPTGEFLELCTITDLSSVWLEADVFEADLGRVLAARRAFLRIPGGDGPRILGRPVAIAGSVDERNRTVRLVYEAQNPDGDLRLGMAVNIGFDLN